MLYFMKNKTTSPQNHNPKKSNYKKQTKPPKSKRLNTQWKYPSQWKGLLEIHRMQRSQHDHTQNLRCSSATNHLAIQGTFWILAEYKSVTGVMSTLSPSHIKRCLEIKLRHLHPEDVFLSLAWKHGDIMYVIFT